MQHFNVFNLTRSSCLRNYLESKLFFSLLLSLNLPVFSFSSRWLLEQVRSECRSMTFTRLFQGQEAAGGNVDRLFFTKASEPQAFRHPLLAHLQHTLHSQFEGDGNGWVTDFVLLSCQTLTNRSLQAPKRQAGVQPGRIWLLLLDTPSTLAKLGGWRQVEAPSQQQQIQQYRHFRLDLAHLPVLP